MGDVMLLPCPFCGESRRENGASTFGLSIAKTRVWWIQCCTCGGEGPSRGDIASLKTKKAAIAAWNTRPAPALTPKQAAADEMAKALEEIWKYAAHGTATKQKDARGRQFAAIHDIAIAALAKAGQP